MKDNFNNCVVCRSASPSAGTSKKKRNSDGKRKKKKRKKYDSDESDVESDASAGGSPLSPGLAFSLGAACR